MNQSAWLPITMQNWLNARDGLGHRIHGRHEGRVISTSWVNVPWLLLTSTHSLWSLLEEVGPQPLTFIPSTVISQTSRKHHLTCDEDQVSCCSLALPFAPRVLLGPFSPSPLWGCPLQCRTPPRSPPNRPPFPWPLWLFGGNFSKVDRSRWGGLAFDCISALFLGRWLCIATVSGFMVSSFLGCSWNDKKMCLPWTRLPLLIVWVRQCFVVGGVLCTDAWKHNALDAGGLPGLGNQNVSRCYQTSLEGKTAPSWEPQF